MELTQNFLTRFQKKPGTLESDLVQAIAKATNRPFIVIRQLTLGRGWNADMLKQAAYLAEKNPIEFWKYNKETKI